MHKPSDDNPFISILELTDERMEPLSQVLDRIENKGLFKMDAADRYVAADEVTKAAALAACMQYAERLTTAAVRGDYMAIWLLDDENLKLFQRCGYSARDLEEADRTEAEARVNDTHSNLPPGVPTKEVVEALLLNDALANKLSHIDRYTYLKPALMRKGDPKASAREMRTHLWNPVKLGQILCRKKLKNQAAVYYCIKKKLSKWFDAWCEATDGNPET